MELNAEPLWHFFNERMAIRNRRYGGQPWPWTTDPILREFSFCEVFRQDDRVTQWINNNWLQPYAGHRNLWLACCIARQINWPDTLQAIGFPDVEPNRMEEWLEGATEEMNRIAMNGGKVYTGAYMIYGGPGAAGGIPDKPTWTMRHVIRAPWNRREEIERYLATIPPSVRRIEWVVTWLSQFQGWSGFMGYEAACDMTYIPLLNRSCDIMSWANPGPGAMRGLNRLFNRPLDWKIPTDKAVAEMQYLLSLANSPSGPLHDDVLIRAKELTGKSELVMRDIESGLCETDKYLRVANGEGRPRAKFVPPEKRNNVSSKGSSVFR